MDTPGLPQVQTFSFYVAVGNVRADDAVGSHRERIGPLCISGLVLVAPHAMFEGGSTADDSRCRIFEPDSAAGVPEAAKDDKSLRRLPTEENQV